MELHSPNVCLYNAEAEKPVAAHSMKLNVSAVLLLLSWRSCLLAAAAEEIVAATATVGRIHSPARSKGRQASNRGFSIDFFIPRLCLEGITHYGGVSSLLILLGKSEYLDWAQVGERYPQASLGPYSLVG